MSPAGLAPAVPSVWTMFIAAMLGSPALMLVAPMLACTRVLPTTVLKVSFHALVPFTFSPVFFLAVACEGRRN